MAKEYFYKPIWGIWKHFIRPRKNIKDRYSTKWALVTGASDGIGKAKLYATS